MNSTSQQNESIEGVVNEFAQRIARVIMAKTIEQLFSGGLASATPASLTHEITNPGAILSGETGATVTARRRLRRSAENVDKDVNKIVAALMGSGGSRLGAERLREATGLSKAELLVPLKRALETGAVTKQGQKRATTYGLPGKVTHAEEGKIPATTFAGKNVIRRKKRAK